MIVFRRGDERFAIASSEILEVVRLGAVTPIPGARAPVRGLSARRGEPMVVLDLGTAGEAAAEPAWALALGDPRLALGVAADEIRELVRLRADEIRPPSASLASDRGWARGITTDAVIVIDAAALIRTHG
ncbi:MAG: chemotaxis protein CheW [Gemmatimonadetes bacterium]|nr:chemotaxis protein CheW [Gemmatimonadota bacterium]